MTRRRLPEGPVERLHMFVSSAEIADIEAWRFRNHIPSKAEAIRRLCRIALVHDAAAQDFTSDAENRRFANYVRTYLDKDFPL